MISAVSTNQGVMMRGSYLSGKKELVYVLNFNKKSKGFIMYGRKNLILT
jgi:hypothetical protein